MKSDSQIKPLSELAKAYEHKDLKVNPEYQRGTKWQRAQRQSLIDSILRGFSIPLFYVHLEEHPDTFTGQNRTNAWIVDGQQRLASITDFISDEFPLADPRKITSGAVLPYQVKDVPKWAGKKYSQLDDDDRQRFLEHQLMLVCMQEDRPNEVRDLFIRLQSGTPLTAQEKRDAWPGNFSEFVIKHAGKANHSASDPHKFFEYIRISGPSKISVDDEDHYIDRRANTRKFFAGLGMTLIVRETTDQDFVDLKGKNINDFYLRSADLEPGSAEAKRVVRVMDAICRLPGVEKFSTRGNKLSYQLAFHLALLVDTFLQGDYVEATWRDRLIEVFEEFRTNEAIARAKYKADKIELPHYSQFIRKLSGSGSDTSSVIRQRHSFILTEIVPALQPRPKDSNRLFGAIEREAIWYRDGGKCRVPGCATNVPFVGAQIHHIEEHTAGGKTIMDNGVLVCASCHSDRAHMQKLSSTFIEYIASTKRRSDSNKPEDRSVSNGSGAIAIQINWPALGIDQNIQLINENNDSETVVKY